MDMKPDPTHATSPRKGKPISAQELGLFLKMLAMTGNFAFSAQAIGRVENALYRRRKRDPLFAARCAEAMAAFQTGRHDDRGGSAMRTTCGALRLVPARQGRPAQFRRLPAGSLTAAGETAFLAAFAATGNVRLAAQSVGISPATIHRRRTLDEDFQRRFDEAAAIAREQLQSLMMERANRTFDREYRIDATGSIALAEQDKVTAREALQFLAWLDRKGRR